MATKPIPSIPVGGALQAENLQVTAVAGYGDLHDSDPFNQKSVNGSLIVRVRDAQGLGVAGLGGDNFKVFTLLPGGADVPVERVFPVDAIGDIMPGTYQLVFVLPTAAAVAQQHVFIVTVTQPNTEISSAFFGQAFASVFRSAIGSPSH
ncbi:hypothetical protein PSAB6_640023 [Paraburkholderia sabiae]|uniref:hypothetical protein n=1 Tax=Paraburkholderia sabiae TaxID=273251 RepID=UPI001CAD3CA4|nr:hypothetical protein [Paraburkholderia sabiae]CAG9235777.1 hypothetical protein PSAB6_640023 [Paraburkholderia sabiae]